MDTQRVPDPSQQVAAATEPSHSQPTGHMSKPSHDSNEQLGNESGHTSSGSEQHLASLKHARAQKAPVYGEPLHDKTTESSSDSQTGRKWFDRANKHPETRFHPSHVDSEPPFFLQRSDSDTSMMEAADKGRAIPIPNSSTLRQSGTQHATNDSSIDDYRSVIDDLTIENKKLKQKLKKFQASHGPQLERDKLLEVRVHGLSQRKKRELEDMLRKFVSGLDSTSSHSYPSDPSKLSNSFHNHTSTSNTSKQPSSASTSNSRPVDSAYASMSTSGGQAGPSSKMNMPMSEANEASTAEKRHGMSAKSKNQKVQSFLRDIPEGLYPKQFPVMSDKAKKKLVVRRLEQLFTGKHDTSSIEDNQSKQQQEISRLAANADLQNFNDRGIRPRREGTREAHMLQPQPGQERSKLARENTMDMSVDNDSDTRELDETKDGHTSEDQRPTRPLDLDPDRAQNAEDNIEYIRHLGLTLADPSAPLANAHDEDGWIYLNLLVNMAQLHIINVTPDFVRSALSEVSEKFQLSRDGRKVRWRGGVEGTRFSSDSGSSGKHGSPSDSDPLDNEPKRRKLEPQSSNEMDHESGSSKFMLEPPKEQLGQSGPSLSAGAFHYKPIFRHAPSSKGDVTMGESDSQLSESPGYDSVTGKPFQRMHGSRASSNPKKQQDDGPIVFYSGAPFYTDLSADRRIIPNLSPQTSIESNSSSEIDRIKSRHFPATLARTASGSTLPIRPLKDLAKVPTNSSSDKSSADELVPEISFSPKWTPNDMPQANDPVHLEASGLGGTRPADHFNIRVQTRRTILDKKPDSPTGLSKYSAPGRRTRKVHHRIAPTALSVFSDDATDSASNSDSVSVSNEVDSVVKTGPSAALLANRSRAGPSKLPIKTEVLSANVEQLPPSELPPPGTYFGMLSSSSSEYSSSEEESEEYYIGKSHRSRSPPPIPMADIDGNEDTSEKESGEADDDNQISDSSLDAFGVPIKVPPLPTDDSSREVNYRSLDDIPAGSSAATHGGGSGFSSSRQPSDDTP